jgi:hypothetical protein
MQVAPCGQVSTCCRQGVPAKGSQGDPTQDRTVQDTASTCAQQGAQLSVSGNKEAEVMHSDQKDSSSPVRPRPAASAWPPQTPAVVEDAYARQERLLDQALADTFPASDPVSLAAPYQGFGNT